MLLAGPFFPKHQENRMKHEGDVAAARKFFYEKRPNNLRYLLHKRYSWMNPYCEGKNAVIELGSGAGFAKEFITNPSLRTSDYVKHPWIDLKIDALNTGLADASMDVVIASHMIHHLARPAIFFREIRRILKPGGYLLIQEIETSLLMRVLLRLMRHEGWSFQVRVFDENEICNDPVDPWSANCAIPQLLFSNPETFEEHIPGFRVLRNELCEGLIFPLSGGVIAKTRTVNLPWWLLKMIDALDTWLIRHFPSVFALGRRVVLQKHEGQEALRLAG